MVNFTKCIVLLKNKRITLAYQYNNTTVNIHRRHITYLPMMLYAPRIH